MTKQAQGRFSIKSWEEKPYSAADESRGLVHASVTQTYTGDLVGEGTLAYLMVYFADGSARFTGLEQVQGALHGQAGSFVLQHSGKFENGVAASDFAVVEGTGTGALAGLRGNGSYKAVHGEAQVPFTLDYDMAEG